MNCPKCEFKMGETDLDCPRCEKFKDADLESPPPRKLTKTNLVDPPRRCIKCDAVMNRGQTVCFICSAGASDNQPLNYQTGQPEYPAATGLQTPISGVKTLGVVLLLCGLGGLYYFMCVFDTSVAAPGIEILGDQFKSGRVNNLGLMADRQNGMVASGVGAVIGTLMVLIGGRK